MFHGLYKLREKSGEIKRSATQILGFVPCSRLASVMLEDEKDTENKFEPQPENSFVAAAKWLYGLGYVAVGTFIYCVYQSSRNNGTGFSLDWLIDLIRHSTGNK